MQNFPAPSPSKDPKPAAFQMWKQRELSDNGIGLPVYPISPTSKRPKHSTDDNKASKHGQGKKKKIYVPVSETKKNSAGSKQSSPRRTRSLDDSAPPALKGANKIRLRRATSCPVKKSVKFGEESNAVHFIETIDELANDIMETLWWSPRDYMEIQQEYEAVIFLLDTGKEVPPEHSACGLSKRTEGGTWELYENQRNARNAVLSQQDLLRKQKKSDPESIRVAYQKETEQVQKEALAQAQSDAAEVQLYMAEGSSSHHTVSYAKVKKVPKSPKRKSKPPPANLNDSLAALGAKSLRRSNGVGVLHFSDDDEIPGTNNGEDTMSIDTFSPTSRDHIADRVKFRKALEYINARQVPESAEFRCASGRELQHSPGSFRAQQAP